jgi:glycosyltransferase involved in cell wall biosynthesis
MENPVRKENRPPLRITYVLEDTALFGGVKVVLQQAALLQHRGHQVTVVSPGPAPTWYRERVPFKQIPAVDPAFFPPADVTVATYWTTIFPVAAASTGEKVHFCQGFEALYTHNRDKHSEIWRVYALPLPALAVAPHLVALLEQKFARPARLVTPFLDPHFGPRFWPARPHKLPRILVFHPYEADWKGVRTALEAVAILRRRGVACRLVRVAQTPPHPEEATLTRVDVYAQHLSPAQVARLMRRCDLLLAPSWEQEAFGLPLLEAMASGVPAVASDIQAFRFLTAGVVPLVPAEDPQAFAKEAEALLTQRDLWRACSQRGRERAAAFQASCVAPQLEEAMYWVASGAWRQETPLSSKVQGSSVHA